MTNTNPDSIDFVPTRTYLTVGDEQWDITYYLENLDLGLVGIDQHFTGEENQNYSNTFIIEVRYD